MTYRDDGEAMLARLSALETEIAGHADAIALRDRRIDDLELQVERLRSLLDDAEAELVDLKRRHKITPTLPDGPVLIPSSPEARIEAERCLVEGVVRYGKGDRSGAATLFERGLALVPGHAELLRAQRRYS
ncbi:MAG: hypothetical protein ABI867_23605 [Kofleriaceae bacterium]